MKKSKVLLLIFFVLAASCAHQPEAPQQAVEQYNEKGDLQNFRVNEPAKEVVSEELETIPIEINENVEKWIKYFQGRGRPHMERYLARSTRYEALMKKVFRDNKLPEDLFYIALIESGFSSSARSHASAVGYWQFIRGTGKRYKLQIDRMIDERRDPVLATQAAAEYFKDLYGIFDSWYLSMAAYNVGEGRVLRAVKKYKTKDFWDLARIKKALPRETNDYVPKYIAAKLIAKNPDKYGFDGIDYMTPIEFDQMTFDKSVNLRLMAESLNFNYEDFKDLNPKFKGEIAPAMDNQLQLRIPPGTFQAAMTAANTSVASVVDFVPDQNEFETHKVKRGETLSTIARKYRTNIAYLREINDLPRKKALKVGQRLYVPDRTPLTVKRPEVVKGKFYIVQPGDSLASIAERYKVSVSDLKKVNGLNRKARIKTGTRLSLPESAVIIEDEKKESKSSGHLNKNKSKYTAKNRKAAKRDVATNKETPTNRQ